LTRLRRQALALRRDGRRGALDQPPGRAPRGAIDPARRGNDDPPEPELKRLRRRRMLPGPGAIPPTPGGRGATTGALGVARPRPDPSPPRLATLPGPGAAEVPRVSPSPPSTPPRAEALFPAFGRAASATGQIHAVRSAHAGVERDRDRRLRHG